MFKAKLLKLSRSVEEEVLLEINGIKLLGFSTICPYKISPDNFYPVNLYFTYLDGPEIEVLDKEEYGVERIADSYGYILRGQVIDGSLNIGNNIRIKDDYLKECLYLNGKYVSLKVDRLGVEFLEN